jgi:hypothetical protein
MRLKSSSVLQGQGRSIPTEILYKRLKYKHMDKDLNFRHIIKTFVPGLFATISILLIFDLLATKINPVTHELIISFIEKNNTLTASLLIPISLFIGITINTFCFVYVIPWIVKNHKKKEMIRLKKGITRKDNFNFYEFSEYKKSVFNFMNEYYYKHLFKDEIKVDFTDFENFFEVDYFLQHRKNISNLHYIKTGYWYYLEFQLNSIIVIFLGLIALNLNLFFHQINSLSL